MVYANYYAVRRIMRLGVEIYFYDKLSVAYNIGGKKGLKEELQNIRANDKMPHELALAKDFEIKLRSLKDPAAFLNDKVTQDKQKVNLIRTLRSVAIILMFLVFGWRLIANFAGRFKSNKV
jgi:hypothetical protein